MGDRLRYSDQMPADMAARANANLQKTDSMYARFNERARNVATYPAPIPPPITPAAQPSSFRWSLNTPADISLGAPLPSVNASSSVPAVTPVTPPQTSESNFTGSPTSPNAYGNTLAVRTPEEIAKFRAQYGWGLQNGN